MSAIRGIIGFVAVGAVLVAICSRAGSESSARDMAASASAAAPKAAEAPKPISVTAVDLWRAYDENEVAADAVYKGKALLVDGAIDSIDKDFTDDIVIHLRTGKMFQFVAATMKPSQAAAAAELKKRQRVELLCKGGTRIIGNPTLEHCEISATWK